MLASWHHAIHIYSIDMTVSDSSLKQTFLTSTGITSALDVSTLRLKKVSPAFLTVT